MTFDFMRQNKVMLISTVLGLPFILLNEDWVMNECHPEVCALILCRRSGKSVTLVTRDDWSKAAELINILERAGQVLYFYPTSGVARCLPSYPL